MNQINKLRTLTQFLCMIAFVLFAGCASNNDTTQSEQVTKLHAFGPLTNNSQWYLSQVSQVKPEQKFAMQVLAVRKLIVDQDYAQADAIMQQLSKEAYTPRQTIALRLLQALELGKQKQTTKALNRLAGIDLRPLDKVTVQFYYRLQSDLLLAGNQKTAAANSLISLDSYLTKEQQTQNHQQIWSLLTNSDAATLKSYVAAAKKMQRNIAAGWFELALISQNDNQVDAYANWQKQYANHPATGLFTPDPKKTAPVVTTSTDSSTVQHIAVFLPLSGKLAAPGNALRAGMEEANLNTHYVLRYYDENSLPMDQLLTKATQEGAQFIVGPLQKDKLDTLLKTNTALPVLGLNKVEASTNANAYFFSLAPDDEAADIAKKMEQDGKNHPLILVPSNTLGERTVSGFNQYWDHSGKTKADVVRFRSGDELMSALRAKLGNGSSSGLQSGEVMSLAPSAQSETVDAIFMLASSVEASTIKSSIDQIMGSNPNRPSFYLGSKSNNAGLRADVALALNGMQLGDMPWMLNQSADLFKKAQTALPQANGDQMRLFAMGYDALNLVKTASHLRQASEQTQAGLTGTLQITTDGVIQRDLYWTRYMSGQLVSSDGTAVAPSSAGSTSTSAPAVTNATQPAQ